MVGHMLLWAHTTTSSQQWIGSHSTEQISWSGTQVGQSFKHSIVTLTGLKPKQQQMNVPEHHLIQDVTARWNSTYLMFV